jgi:taurine dioxygenase
MVAVATAAKTLEIVPTGGPLGAEVRGVDLSQDQPGEIVFDILQAFRRHQVLFFRGQDLTEERFIRVGEWFGPMYTPPPGIPMLGDEDQGLVTTLENLGNEGVTANNLPLPPHSDLQYMPVPLLGAMLFAVEVPAEGGDTGWANLYQAYDELDDETKRKLEGVRGIGFNPYAGMFGKAVSTMMRDGQQKFVAEDVPEFPHPIVRTHPDTGRKSLYFSLFINKLVGLDDPAEEAELLGFLREHTMQPHFVWWHKWQAGDVLVWDNRCTNHARQPFDPSARRSMRRLQLAGTRPF